MPPRRIAAFLLSLLVVSLGACGGGTDDPSPVAEREAFDQATYSGRHAFVSDVDGNHRSTVRILNPGSRTVVASLDIDGFLFRDREALLDAIRRMPGAFPGEPDFRKAWRLVGLRTYHWDPMTAGSLQHDPLLYLNSFGFGSCDDSAAVLAAIWAWQGHESRVWGLQGHVVPEIRVGERWELHDAHYGVHYLDAAHQVASVRALAADPSLILAPNDPIYPPDFPGYGETLASIYSGVPVDDNFVFADALRADASHEIALHFVPGAEFEFPVRVDWAVTAYNGNPVPVVGAARMTVPAGTADVELPFPFVVLDVAGAGEVEIDGVGYGSPSPALARRLRGDAETGEAPGPPVTSLKIVRATEALSITLAVNPFVTDGAPDALFTLLQRASDPRLSVSLQERAPSELSEVSRILSGASAMTIASPMLTQRAISSIR